MTAPGERRLRARIRRRRRGARAALAWEALWPALWPAAGVAGLFLTVALADLLPLLPGVLHAAILAGFLAALVLALRRGLRHLRLPDGDAAGRRLERDSGLAHRPLTVLEDSLAAGGDDPAAAALWQHHRSRALAALARPRVAAPAPGLARHDRRALRVIVGTGLLATAVGAGAAAPDHVVRALAPDLAATAPAAPVAFDVWIDPPDYTVMSPVLLTGPGGSAAGAVPDGSVVLARVHGGSARPRVTFGPATTEMQAVDGRAWHAEVPLGSDGDRTVRRVLRVQQGGTTLGAWSLAVVPDGAPEIAFAEPPAATRRRALRLAYAARDDYGLDQAAAVIRRGDGAGDDAVRLPLPLPGRSPSEARATGYHDLTAHPWAGLEVTVTLEATDGRGQGGRSRPSAVTLPEREFLHPVARAIIEERRRLAGAPGGRVAVARQLAAIAAAPQRYGDDLVVFMALTAAQARLVHDDSDGAAAEILDLLWDTALHVEEGRAAVIERRLRALQRELADALDGDASDDELDRLISELREVMDDYVDALGEQLRRQLYQGLDTRELPSWGQIVQRQDLREMVDRLSELTRLGAREAALQLLLELQELLENLQRGPGPWGPGGPQGEAGRLLDELQQLMGRQQDLLDETYRQAGRQGGRRSGEDAAGTGQRPPLRPGGDGPQAGAPDAAGRQEALRRALGEIMRRLGEATGTIPGALGRAERFMRDAREALASGQPGSAVAPQSDALDQLQRGAWQILQQMSDGRSGGPGWGYGRFPGQPGGRDPFGRRFPGGGWDRNSIGIPEEAELRRAREILDELRRRAGERARPSDELDYIDRLLRRF